MALTNDAVVQHLTQMLSTEQVITDAEQLTRSSVDNFRKLQNIFDVHTMTMPTAIVMVRSTAEVAKVLAFADEHGGARRHGRRKDNVVGRSPSRAH